ncbi:Rho-GTPase-activating protein 5 [Cyphellophora attinorum]|uniref:Rho-GTPase-activating protein 5 n=1 Tax=Cyphellophora attinorum TaxID=1664694 RepID=A0A0N0NPV3_9EURO|nr:Rho-GTPase-activating protein 5 [Phialophora attinorum]KPI43191.1 Rho-GTPase-activating protein 5 [Phialophora attinorum]
MATGGTAPSNDPIPPQPSHHGAQGPPSAAAQAASPPSKRELASWWKKFRKTTEKQDEKVEAPGIFGVPLDQSIRYANVAISLSDEQGNSFIYGYIPIVVAKCGVFLKEKATDVEGIFRLSGSAKRIKDLQTAFNSPDRYGKGLDWTGYTVHDAANILRRYLNQLPEPIVPLDFYERFRDPLRPYATKSTGDNEAQPIDMTIEQHGAAVVAYQKLITELPPLSRQLLLYILDLLAVFASKSDMNRMNAANLAAIFQPGIISHPQHDMAPTEYRLSQDVLIFLIENQDNFLIGMTGTAVDEKTQKDVESGAPSVRSPAVGRSASNASAGADSLRKYGVRRNVSVSSGNSRERGSPGVSSPGTPTGMNQLSTVGSNTGGIGRSNTVPSKRSPALAGSRFQRMQEQSASNSPVPSPEAARMTNPPATNDAQDQQPQFPSPQHAPTSPTLAQSPSFGPQAVSGAPKERKISNLFSKSPFLGPPEASSRPTKKLQKRGRIAGSGNESAASSQASLHGEDTPAFHTPLVSPNAGSAAKPDPIATHAPHIQNTTATPVETPTSAFPSGSAEKSAANLQPARSPAASLHSGTSVTDHSEFDALDSNASPAVAGASPPEKDKRRHRWRFSSSAKRSDDFPLAPPPPIGSNAGARGSNSSFGSSRPRKSFTGDSGGLGSSQHDREGSMMTGQSLVGASTHSRESGELLRDVTNTGSNTSGEEKKGLFGKWKAKLGERNEQKKLEKERAKSPPGAASQGQSRSSLSAMASPNQGPRGRSFEGHRGSQSSGEGGMAPNESDRAPASTLPTVTERPVTEAKERAEMTGLPQQGSAQPALPATTALQTNAPSAVTQSGVAQNPVSDSPVSPTTVIHPQRLADQLQQAPQGVEEQEKSPTTQ